jgi:N-glycosylase/DNA lyase
MCAVACIPLRPETPLDLEATLDCGQVFRWGKVGEWWYGVIGGDPFALRQTCEALEIRSNSRGAAHKVSRYLALDHDLPAILSSFRRRDQHLQQAVRAYRGLRIIRQPFWECAASFALATAKNVPAIQHMLESLCARFGERVTLDGQVLHRFPAPAVIAGASEQALRCCGLGFRAPHLKAVAQAFVDGRVREEEFRRLDCETAARRLMELPGIGPKVAECILLFGLERLGRVPVDVNVKRLFCDLYGVGLCAKNGLTPGDHRRIGEWARGHFGEYAGYAQQYLFHAARTGRLAGGQPTRRRRPEP